MKKYSYLLILFFSILIVSCDNDNDYTPIEENNYPVAEFLPKLSELKMFKGDLANLEPADNVEIYSLNTPLFTDYAQKLRFISIPEGKSMTYTDGGLPVFPDNTIITKTFYYYADERDPSLGKTIIETRTLIKKSGVWNIGNYVWNEDNTEAFLDDESHELTINWIDSNGAEKTVDYVIPTYLNCVTCHQNNGARMPIGPKVRNLNGVHDGINQLQDFIDKGLITGAPAVSEIEKLPVWDDSSQYSLDERARAYLDVNCAHCHQPGGFWNLSFGDSFELRYETPFDDTNIYPRRNIIVSRMQSEIEGYAMPFIGTSLIHSEGVALIEEYVESLD